MQNGKSFDEKILDKIEKEKIKPEPKWKFLLKDYFIWGTAILALVVGGLANSILIHQIRFGDLDIYPQLDRNLLGFIIVSIPYIWIILLAVLIVSAIYNFKHTKRGYKYNPVYIILGSIILSFLLGGILNGIGIGRMLDENFEKNSVFYTRYIGGRHKPWLFPEKGFLGGVVVAVEDKNHFLVKDFASHIWKVQADEANITKSVKIEVDSAVRMVGRALEDDLFKAVQIMPMGDHMRFPFPPPPNMPDCKASGTVCPF